MAQRRELCIFAGLVSTLAIASGASCTPDERTLGVGLGSARPGAAGNDPSLAGASDAGGSSGRSGTDGEAGQALDAGAAGATSAGRGGSEPPPGGLGGSATGSSSGSGGAVATSGSSSSGASGAGASPSGACADDDHNGVDDCSESLVQNASFDSNVAPWISGQWNASNAHPVSGSGSLLVMNDLPILADVGFNLKAAEQCIQVTGDLTYRVAARVLIPPGQGAGFGGINLWIFANDACKGTFVTGLSPAMTETTSTWTQLDAQFKMPTAARSMIVRLAATRPFSQEKLQVLFDDILVKQQLP